MKLPTLKTASSGSRRLACLFVLFYASVLSVAAEDYGFYFASVYVNSNNCNPIAHQNNIFEEGTATYNSTTKTLTLTDVKVTRSGSGKNCIDNETCDGLTVVLKGNCYLYSEDDYAVVTRDENNKPETNIRVEGITTIESKNKSAICFQEDDGVTQRNIDGPGTLNVKSRNSYAMEGTSWSSIILNNGITATFEGGKGALRTLRDVKVKDGSNVELTLKATNNSSYPVVSSTVLYFFSDMEEYTIGGERITPYQITHLKPPVILKPWGAEHGNNNREVIYHGSSVYDQDIVISTRYDVLITRDFFPDPNFFIYLEVECPQRYIASGDTQTLSTINVNNKNIHSLKGIEYLTHLKNLNCQNNHLTMLDLDDNDELTSVKCSNNDLYTLKLTNKPNLITVDCSNNAKLEEIDCRYNPKMTSLNCYNNEELEQIYVTYNNQLAMLDCHGDKQLKELNCYDAALTSLNISGCSVMEELDCSNNKLQSLNVSGNSALKTLNCSYNQLSSLNISGCNGLTTLNCNNNQLKVLEAVNLKKLNVINCENNMLTSINLSGSALNLLNCKNNKFEMLELASNIVTLRCDNNPLLWYLYCPNINLYNLSVTNCNALVELNCSNNNLKGLEVESLSSLSELNCSGNKIESLDMSQCSNLVSLECNTNSLTTLSISGCNQLQTLDCSKNQLTQLNLPRSTSLSRVYCSDNRIAGADMDALVAGLSNRKNLTQSGLFYVYDSTSTTEENVCTTQNVSDAKRKNWDSYWFTGSRWQLYGGKIVIPTDVHQIETAGDNDAPRYNLSGQRIGNNYKGIVIQGNRKMVKQ